MYNIKWPSLGRVDGLAERIRAGQGGGGGQAGRRQRRRRVEPRRRESVASGRANLREAGDDGGRGGHCSFATASSAPMVRPWPGFFLGWLCSL